MPEQMPHQSLNVMFNTVDLFGMDVQIHMQFGHRAFTTDYLGNPDLFCFNSTLYF